MNHDDERSAEDQHRHRTFDAVRDERLREMSPAQRAEFAATYEAERAKLERESKG